jgi:hypothetical protein
MVASGCWDGQPDALVDPGAQRVQLVEYGTIYANM